MCGELSLSMSEDIRYNDSNDAIAVETNKHVTIPAPHFLIVISLVLHMYIRDDVHHWFCPYHPYPWELNGTNNCNIKSSPGPVARNCIKYLDKSAEIYLNKLKNLQFTATRLPGSQEGSSSPLLYQTPSLCVQRHGQQLLLILLPWGLQVEWAAAF